MAEFYSARDETNPPLPWTTFAPPFSLKTVVSGSKFRDNAIRLKLHALAYNLTNFKRTLALPREVEHWSLTTLWEKLVKIGAKVVRHGRYVTFQLAEVAVPRGLFQKILAMIDDLRRRPAPA